MSNRRIVNLAAIFLVGASVGCSANEDVSAGSQPATVLTSPDASEAVASESSEPPASGVEEETEPVLAVVRATQTTPDGYALEAEMTVYAPGPTEQFTTWMGSSVSTIFGACSEDRSYFEAQGVQVLSARVTVEDASPAGYEWTRGTENINVIGPGLDKGWVGTWSTGSAFQLPGCGTYDPLIDSPGLGDLLWYRDHVYTPNQPDGDLAPLRIGLAWLNEGADCNVALGSAADDFSSVYIEGGPLPADGFCGLEVPGQEL